MPRGNLGDLLGAKFRKQDEMMIGQSPAGEIPTYFVVPKGVIRIRHTNKKVEHKVLQSQFVLGSPTQGILGTSKLGRQFSAYITDEDESMYQQLTDVGKNEVANFLASESADGISYVAIGSSGESFNSEDTILGGELIRVNSTSSNLGKTFYIEAEFDTIYASNETIREVGLFNDPSSGDMIGRIVIDDFSKGPSDYMKVTIETTLENQIPIVDDGVYVIRNFLAGASETPPTHIAWGEGSTSPALTDTTMESEIERNKITNWRKLELEAVQESMLTGAEANGSNLTRIGMFNSSVGGSMFIHYEMPNLAKTSRIELFTEAHESIV
ncbi:MAG: hypothetical protein ACTSXD_08500 [Candidatus Heimdallarchaeaceae archaeon]